LSRDDLLRPTLSEFRRAPALYNSTGLALSAFFGGPLGAGIYGAANTFRLGRLPQDLTVIVVLVAAGFLIPLELQRLGILQDVVSFFGAGTERGYGIVLRALGLACFGAIYLLHRRFFRAAKVAGSKSLAGWLPGIAGVALGLGANTVFIDWFLKHH
jgi:hypothetical protein